ncbi:vitamin B12-dependent ribonucleotide reductase [Deferribacterales bacterium Es71-Z0220]|uniref:vitamin B12-dependent ribonucleotide reductase n=1 Tax=Deferrivibrio essentukiensis TaxID=2880922 RepID=UPI001F617269|nr:vitamin B12-dependent ribonucleotide reductase [Deferrivibrio essentukiensis]MCB4204689.1 vitamin B12-dependent ribonucleotide reductase [Deferrivibrio essentukiensis]
MIKTDLLEKLNKEPKLSANAVTVLKKRYLKKDEDGNVVETPQGMFQRVALNIANAELKYGSESKYEEYAVKFYDMMVDLKFLPNSPTLMNAGKELQQLSACFVLPVEDSLEKIFEAVKHTALIHKSGGGTGFSFSRLRPKDDVVKTTKGVSSGPVSFMSVFDSATETIKQGGTRRGANMGILRVDHPDIMEFIYAKQDKSKLTNFNLSVAITEEFMEKALKNEEYELKNPKTGKTVKKLNAKDVFDQMVKLAWEGGDPGIIFIDRINKFNPTPKEGEMESTNPCGEQPLLPYESCNLGSINLGRFVKGNDIDWDDLRYVVQTGVRFLDDVIDMNSYPIKEIEQMTKKNRKIGLGVMGFADMLAMLDIPYNSEEAIEMAEKVMKFIQEEGRIASSELAKERGNFPNFDDSIYPGMGFSNMRNATVTTIAPTGTISIIGGCSSGVEPYFAIAFYRNVMDNNKLVEVNPIFKERAKKEGFFSKELMDKIAEQGTLHDIEEVPSHIKKVFVTAHEISPIWHVRMQAAFQKYTDNAVSKTVNFPNDATVDDVREVYVLAYKQGCKGITIYRDGSRDAQVINLGTKEKSPKEEIAQEYHGVFRPRPRPKVLFGKTLEMMTGCGKLYVTINFDENNEPFEVFTSMGKAGGCAQSQCEAIGRLISLVFRSGGDYDIVVKQLKGISCHMRYGFGQNQILSCADAVGKAIEKAIMMGSEFKVINQEKLTVDKLLAEAEKKVASTTEQQIRNGACPECGGPIQYVEGCDVCHSCGYSHCS